MQRRKHRLVLIGQWANSAQRVVMVVMAGLALSAGANTAMADVIVIGSSAANLKLGAVIKDDATLDLKAGERVRIMLPSGRTQELKGPTAVKVATLGAGEQRNDGLWNDVRRLVADQKTASESQVGAVRSVVPKSRTSGASDLSATRSMGAGAPTFSWRQVSIDSDGDVCVEKSAPLELLRGAPGRPISVTVVNLQSKTRAAADFGVGSATTAWPQAVGVDVGRYTVVLPDGAKREIRLRPIDPLPVADDTIRLLHSQRCLKQVEAWLRGQLIAVR